MSNAIRVELHKCETKQKVLDMICQPVAENGIT